MERTDERSLALTVTEAARLLRLSRPTVYKLMKEDPTFPVFKIGTRSLISRRGLERWIDEQTLGGAAV